MSGCRVASRAALACAHENRRISGECLSTLATKVLCITQSPFPSGGGPAVESELGALQPAVCCQGPVESGAQAAAGRGGVCRVVRASVQLLTSLSTFTLPTNEAPFGGRR